MDFVRAFPLNDAVIDLWVHPLVAHEIGVVVFALYTRVPDDVLRPVMRNRRNFPLVARNTFRHLQNIRTTAPDVLIHKRRLGWLAKDKCFVSKRSIQETLYSWEGHA